MTDTVSLKKMFDEAFLKSDYVIHRSKKRKRTKWNNKSGFYRVQKIKCKGCKQGYTWVYRIHTEDGEHRITRTNIAKLRKEVKQMGFKWFVIDEKKASQTAKESGYLLKVLR